MIQNVISSLSEKEIKKAPKSRIPVVFLGGKCEGNDWREEIEKEFGKNLYLLDPYDKKYDSKEDAHKELAGIVNSDYVIFYKGGEQSDREKEFLDLIGRNNNLVKEFNDMDSLKKFLKKLKEVNLESISSKIRKCARALIKIATPFSGNGFDFHFEKLDADSILKVVQDIFKGETVHLPVINGGNISYVPFKAKGPDDPNIGFLKPYLKSENVKSHYDKFRNSVIFYYDDVSNKYELIKKPEPALVKVAKEGVNYEYSITKIDLPDDLSDSVMSWGEKNIPEKDLFIEDGMAKGRENDIHITVLYGITDQKPNKTSKVIKETKPFEVRLGLINAFKDNKKYDVIKIEIESGDLEKLHYELRDRIHNENTFPTYNPHVTIAYVKKNSCDRFIGDETFKGKTFKVKNIVFSDGTDKEDSLPLRK